MTIQEFVKQGNKWIDLKGVPVRESDRKEITFIHNKFFEGKELEFQNKLITSWMEICPDEEWCWRVYGGDKPDANMVGWIYTQVADIVRTIDAVRNYVESKGGTTDTSNKKFVRGWHPSKGFIEKTARIFCLNYTYQEGTGEFTLSGFTFRLETTKCFNVCYNDIHEPHKCGNVILDNGQVIGYFSGNIFDGYRSIININNQRTCIIDSTDSHLMKKIWKHLTGVTNLSY